MGYPWSRTMPREFWKQMPNYKWTRYSRVVFFYSQEAMQVECLYFDSFLPISAVRCVFLLLFHSACTREVGLLYYDLKSCFACWALALLR